MGLEFEVENKNLCGFGRSQSHHLLYIEPNLNMNSVTGFAIWSASPPLLRCHERYDNKA